MTGRLSMCPCLPRTYGHDINTTGGSVVKNPPAMQETGAQSLGCDDTLEKGMVIHSSILAWRNLMDRGAWRATVHSVAESDVTKRLSAACTY